AALVFAPCCVTSMDGSPTIGGLLDEQLGRDFDNNDKLNGLPITTCYSKKGVPCYVAIDNSAGAHTVVGYIKIYIPYEMTPQQEAAVRAKLSPHEKKGSFGNIQMVEVAKSYRGQGIGTHLMNYAIDKGRSVPDILAMTLTVSKKNTRAIELYKKLGFIQVMEGRFDFFFAFYYQRRTNQSILRANSAV
ncbi:hypothetical protein FOL47_004466, partial [Perkinsus chesapeaki]